MYSFYGGKQGRTYHLVHHYDSIKQMVDEFQKGGSYNEVNYGEYVIIDTIINKHEPRNFENGIIYRRGLNYQEYFNSSFTINLGTEEEPNIKTINVNSNNSLSKEDLDDENEKVFYDESTDIDGNRILIFNETKYNRAISAFAQHPGGGAQYVGKIVGPKGEAPQLSFVKWSNFKTLCGLPENTDLHKDTIQIKDSDLRPGAQFNSETGEVIDTSIVDAIHYGYLDIVDAYGNITGAYISIDYPYSVFKYHAESISPYPDYRDSNNSESGGYTDHPGRADHSSGSWEYTNLITEDQISTEHPFFWQYDIKVPKGIRGQDLKESGIHINRNLETGDTVGTENWVDQQTGAPILDENNNPVTDINYRYYNVYVNYENSEQGEETTKYLDSWQRTIHKIVDNGKLNKYDLVDRSGNTSYKVGDKATELTLKNNLYLQAIAVKGNRKPKSQNTFRLNYMKPNDTFQDGNVTWKVCQSISPSQLIINYTHGDPDLITIRTIDKIQYDQPNGRLYVKYSDLDDLTYLGEYKNIKQIRYIKNTQSDTDLFDTAVNVGKRSINRICIIFNTFRYDPNGNLITDSMYSINNNELKFPTTAKNSHQVLFIDEPFKFVNSIEIINNNKVDQNTEYVINYNNEESVSLGNLNELVCLQQYGDNIIAFYNNPQKRRQMYKINVDYALPWSHFGDVDFQNRYGYDIPAEGSSGDDGQGRYYWINLGSIYKSNHIFGKFNSLSDLQTQFPYGFDKDLNGSIDPSMKDFAGWLATVVTTDGNSETITTYAYDYHNGQGWYKLEDLNIKNINPTLFMIMSKPDDNDLAKPPLDQDKKLNDNGYWFIISERTD